MTDLELKKEYRRLRTVSTSDVCRPAKIRRFWEVVRQLQSRGYTFRGGRPEKRWGSRIA